MQCKNVAVAVQLRERIQRHPWIAATVLVIACLCVIVAYSAVSSYVKAQDALRNVNFVEHHLSLAESSGGRDDLQQHLKAAEIQLTAAKSSFATLGVLPMLRFVPYFGADVSGTQQLLSDALAATRTGERLVTVVSKEVAQGPKVALTSSRLQQLGAEIDASVRTLASLDRPQGSLYGPVGSNRASFNAKVTKLVSTLQKASDGVELARSIFATPHSKVLVLPENNAEMREQGAILSYTLLSVAGTDVREIASGPASSVVAPAPVSVPASAGTKYFFYGNGANQDLRFVNATADFSWSGRTAAAIFRSSTGVPVGTVVALDVPAMASLLHVTGPLYVPSAHVTLDEHNFSRYVLHDLYEDYPVGSQGPRKAELNEIAALLLERIKGSTYKEFQFLRALSSDIPGRHLLVWSSIPRVETAITGLGASGLIDAPQPDATFHLAVESAVAAKLDYYVRVSQRISVQLHANGSATVNTVVTETNTAPAGQKSSYALGPDGLNAKVPGEYVSNTYLWSPAGSFVSGGHVESGLVLNGTSVVVMPQSSGTAYFSTVIPHAVHANKFVLRLIPQSRLFPIVTSVSVSRPSGAVQGGIQGPFDLTVPVSLIFADAG